MGSELDFGVVFGMGECTEFHIDGVCSEFHIDGVCSEFHIDGVCSEFGFGSFPEMSVRDCVPLQLVQ